MSQEIQVTLSVKDDGSLVIKNFADQVKRSMTEAEASVEKHATAWTNFKNNWAMMTAGIASGLYIFNQVKGYVQPMIDAFLEAEAAEKKLQVALKNMGEGSVQTFENLKQFATELQGITAHSDEAVMGIMTVLKSFGMSNDVMKTTTMAVMDLSVGLGVDLTSAAKMMGKAFVGETGSLSRFGITVDDTKSSAEKFQQVLEQVQMRFGGQAQAELETYGGQWKRLKNEISDTAEKVGGFIAKMTLGPVISEQTKALATASDVLMNSGGSIEYVSNKTIEMVKELEASAVAWEMFSGEAKKWTPVSEEVVKSTKKVIEETEKLSVTLATIGQSDFEKKLALLELEKKMMLQSSADKTEIEKLYQTKKALLYAQNAEEIKKIDLKQKEELIISQGKYYDETQEMLDLAAKIEAEKKKAANAADDKMREQAIISWGIYYDRYLELLNEAERLKAKQRIEEIKGTERQQDQMLVDWENYNKNVYKINQDLYSDLADLQQDNTDFKLNKLYEEYARRKELLGNSELLEQWFFKSEQRIMEERILMHGSFWDGVQVQMNRNLRDQITWAQQGAAIWNGVFGRGGALEGTLNVFFGDLFTGKLKSAKEYFAMFCNELISLFAKACAQMAAQWIQLQITGQQSTNNMMGQLSSLQSYAQGLMGYIDKGVSYATGQLNSVSSLFSSLFGGGSSLGGDIPLAGGVNWSNWFSGLSGGSQSGSLSALGGAGGGAAAAIIAVSAAATVGGIINELTQGALAGSNPFYTYNANGVQISGAGLQPALLYGKNVTEEGTGAINSDSLTAALGSYANSQYLNADYLAQLYYQQHGYYPERTYQLDAKTAQAYYSWLGTVSGYNDVLMGMLRTSQSGAGTTAYNPEGGGMAEGGVINEPMVAWSRSGKRISLGEKGREFVIPEKKLGFGGLTVIFNVQGNLIADNPAMDSFIADIEYALSKRAGRNY